MRAGTGQGERILPIRPLGRELAAQPVVLAVGEPVGHPDLVDDEEKDDHHRDPCHPEGQPSEQHPDRGLILTGPCLRRKPGGDGADDVLRKGDDIDGRHQRGELAVGGASQGAAGHELIDVGQEAGGEHAGEVDCVALQELPAGTLAPGGDRADQGLSLRASVQAQAPVAARAATNQITSQGSLRIPGLYWLTRSINTGSARHAGSGSP